MKEKMKWIVLLFMMAMVLWGIQKAESVVTEGKSRMQKADVVIDLNLRTIRAAIASPIPLIAPDPR